MRPLPLKYRLPNPPAVFVGREQETAWLAEAIGRAPVTVVVGPGGLGKTALVLHTLHTRFARKIARALFVRVEPGASPEEARQDVVRALAEAKDIGAVDWSAIQGDPDALTAALIDLAEEGGWWIAIDDLHHLDGGDAAAFLFQLARYARKSRFVVTTRMDLAAPELASQTLVLGAMRDVELTKLADAWGASDDVQHLVKALAVSGGSPWLLQQCLATGRAEPAVTRDSLLRDLPRETIDFLDALSVLETSLPLDTVRTFAPVPDADALSAIERRGLVEATQGGVRLHDVVRNVLRATGDDPGRAAWSARAGKALAAHHDLVAVLEGARLLLELDEIEAVEKLLEDRTAEMFADGWAPRLWRLLERASGGRLDRWRLRCAAELGNPTALSKVQEPARSGVEERITWGWTLLMQGEVAAAAEVAREARAAASRSRDGGAAIDAAFLLAECLVTQGFAAQAEDVLAGAPALDPDALALRDATLAAVRAAGAGPKEAAAALARDVRRRMPELSPDTRVAVAQQLAEGFAAIGMLDDALDLVRIVQASPRGGSLSLYSARRALSLRAAIETERGALDDASHDLEQLRPYIRSSSLLRPQVCGTMARMRLARGDAQDLDRMLDDVVREATLFDARPLLDLASALRLELAMLEGGIATVPAIDAARPSRSARLLALRRWEASLRHAERTGTIEAPDEIADDLGLVPVALSVRALERMIAGDAEGAIGAAQAAVRDASGSSHAVREAEARVVLADVLLATGRTDELSIAADALRSLGERLRSPRFVLLARLAGACVGADADFSLLTDIASQGTVAPMAARRAQRLLGAGVPLDRVDRAVLDAILARPGWAPPAPIGAAGAEAEWGAAWVIDTPRARVFLPGNRDVDFAKRPLHFRILELLAAQGGSATKEQLVLEVWNEAEYHPLRHDPRLQMAVRKLRELIEDDASHPARVITIEDGYALGGSVLRVPAA